MSCWSLSVQYCYLHLVDAQTHLTFDPLSPEAPRGPLDPSDPNSPWGHTNINKHVHIYIRRATLNCNSSAKYVNIVAEADSYKHIK